MRKLKYILRDFSRELRHIPNNIHNLIVWIPVIWDDRPWDYDYFYRILHKKLSLMEDFYKKGHAVCKNADKTEKEIRTARILCGRLISRDYLANEIPRKPEDEELIFTPCSDNPKLFAFVDKRSDKEKQDYKKANLRALAKEKADREYMFDLIKNKIETWWD